MARPDKASAVAELTDEFRSSNAAVLTEYRGLTVKQLQELRRALGENASYTIVKNTLTKIAAKEAGVEGFDDLLVGPSAIAFVKGDPVEAAKRLRDFAKTNSPLVIKGGVLDGKPLTPTEIGKIADLESREVLLAQLAAAMLASLQNAVSLLNAPLAQAARLIGALQAKAEVDPSLLAGGAGEAPVAEEPVSVAPVDEVPVAEPPADETTVAAVAEASAESPVAEPPAEEATVAPADEAPVAEAPVAEAPVSVAPADEAPVAPADEAPVAEAHQSSASETSEV